MATEFIQKVLNETRGQERSVSWFRKKIKEFGAPTSTKLIREGKRSNNPFFGRLNMFFYSPKYKDKLPYYDRFPLVLPLEKNRGGFMGINMHYLPIPLRAELLDKLYEFSSNDKFDNTTRLTATYNNVKNIDLVRPTLHRYLYNFVESQFRRIDANEFIVATLLPVQRFKKATDRKVWRDSRRMI
ncbi:uncharacterized protein METZ01_LOCUS120476 [marine metagenome]|uniref:DNA end protector protein n=1 Tax=marine metagenome TaxID=408172 RepID=A0A381XT16_9ZZZZ